MSFQFKKDESAALNAGQGGMTTGVYKVAVEAVVYKTDSKGNPRADFYFKDADGKRAIVFGMCIAEKWSTGSDNLNYQKWQEFAAVCGMETGSIAHQNVQTKKDLVETKNCFVECTGKTINVALQETFDIQSEGANAGKETNDKNIYRTFNAEGKTLAEAQTNTAAKVIEAVKSSLKPYETKVFKDKKAGGANAETGQNASAPVADTPDDDSLI